MKILGICGSHRKGGSSYVLLEEAMNGVKDLEALAETKIIELATLKIGPCIAVCPVPCGGEEPFGCNVKDDLQMVFNEMKSADGILMASPRYFIVPSKLQALIERLYCSNYITKYKNPSATHPLADKPVGFLTVSASGGYSTMPLLAHLEKFCLWLDMRPVTIKNFPFRGVVAKDPASKDAKALQHARTLGQVLAKAVKEMG